jgi:hypothetical protein
MVVEADANDVQRIGLNCIGFPPERTRRHHETTNVKHFESAFGINPQIASIVFQEIQTRDIGNKRVNKPKLCHFLMALYWLKRYPVEKICAGLFGYDEDTVRKWIWIYCKAIQALKPYKVK